MSDDNSPDPRDKVGYEQAFAHGRRSAWANMLLECLRQLGHDDPGAARHQWVVEREEVIRALRAVCHDHGENDWPDDAYLPDVISNLHDRLQVKRP